MSTFRAVVLIAAVMSMGLMAGVFGHYAHTVMPALRRTDDRTFVAAFQAIDRKIINPWFIPTYFGAFVSTGLAAALHLGQEGRAALPWITAALVLYLAVIVITIRVHLPLNDGIKAAGDIDHMADPAGVRSRFDEARWARWNLIRTLASTVALGCLAVALVRSGASP